jgi:hypothetical protein
LADQQRKQRLDGESFMETRMPNGNSGQGSAAKEASSRRRKKNSDVEGARFFLPKLGSSLKVPELGQEMDGEGDALVEALKSGQVFYALTVFRAVAQQNGGYPVITKQAVIDSKAE